MTKEKFTEMFESMIPDHIEAMKKSLQKLLNSGGIDISNIPEDNYREVKKSFCAILQNESFQYKPLYNKNKQDIKDIENYKIMC